MEKNWPNLFVPGAGKSGTTSLHRYLDLHPLISMSRDKEPAFFNDEKNFVSRTPFYLDLFDHASHIKYRGEASTAYMTSSVAVRNIKLYAPDPKFIFVLRNPIDRAYSHYKWMRSLGYEKLDFEDAFHKNLSHKINTKKNTVGFGNKVYYQDGLYSKWLETYFSIFAKENVHIITSENLKESPHQAVNSCFEFLDLKPLEYIEAIEDNITSGHIAPRRYRVINNLLFNQGLNPVKFLYQKVIPPSIRGVLRNQIVKKQNNTLKSISISSTSQERLSTQQRVAICAFYEKDVNVLRNISGLNFEEWHDFN